MVYGTVPLSPRWKKHISVERTVMMLYSDLRENIIIATNYQTLSRTKKPNTQIFSPANTLHWYQNHFCPIFGEFSITLPLFW